MPVPAALRFHFGDDKTKSILFGSKPRAKIIRKISVRYKEINYTKKQQS